jgi:hypothetical protein
LPAEHFFSNNGVIYFRQASSPSAQNETYCCEAECTTDNGQIEPKVVSNLDRQIPIVSDTDTPEQNV